MRAIGFSTGALAAGDFERALDLLRGRVDAIELSALRFDELGPLVERLPALDLGGFRFVSFHAPSWFPRDAEEWVLERLLAVAERGLPIVVHPDAPFELDRWRQLGSRLTIENMDLRKTTGRFADELRSIFAELPEARLCLDLAHSRQTDPTMTECCRILREFGERLAEIHLSEVNARGRHARLSLASTLAYQQIARHLPADVAVILESPVEAAEVDSEVVGARKALAAGSRRA